MYIILFVRLLLLLKKNKHGFLSLLHLKVINIYTYNFNLYQNKHGLHTTFL